MTFSSITEKPLPVPTPAADVAAGRYDEVRANLKAAFQADFLLLNVEDREIIAGRDVWPAIDGTLLEMAGAVSRFALLEQDTLITALVIRVPLDRETSCIAIAPVLTNPANREADFQSITQRLGASTAHLQAWLSQQLVWPPAILEKTVQAVYDNLGSQSELHVLRNEVDQISDNLASTYEEISLLYGVTKNLRISRSEEDMGRMALDWLSEVSPADGLAVQYLPTDETEASTLNHREQRTLVTHGACPLTNDELTQFLELTDLTPNSPPFVVNLNVTGAKDWAFPTVRQAIVVPLSDGETIFGWMAAFNHRDDSEFGTVEASLLSSVGAILGIHSGNIKLYRMQEDFTANVVHALTSAIDAKDPYTCGHSDRVARVSVRLAQEMGVDDEELNSLYMAGLLHDIGKIGIDDNVLRKPGQLTPAEYEHIKLHPTLGYNILRNLKPLQHVLPVVRHHHEQWDGKGYPSGLRGKETPLLARIVAVADAFDAMSSDRPYRKGMPADKVGAIFEGGSGTQWDAAVIDAFFAARDDIHAISSEERADLTLNVQQWT
jgi:putative nucleotidyltransferase with HDIG domain